MCAPEAGAQRKQCVAAGVVMACAFALSVAVAWLVLGHNGYNAQDFRAGDDTGAAAGLKPATTARAARLGQHATTPTAFKQATPTAFKQAAAELATKPSRSSFAKLPAAAPGIPSRMAGPCCSSNRSCCVKEAQLQAEAQEKAERDRTATHTAAGATDALGAAKLRAGYRADLQAAARKEAPTIEAAFKKLKTAYELGDGLPDKGWFEDIDVMLPLGKELMRHGDGRGQSARGIAGSHVMEQLGAHCTIYGAGVNYEVLQTGTKYSMPDNCWVHTFDCTMVKKVVPYLHAQSKANDRVVFHPWCVGAANATLHVNFDYGANGQALSNQQVNRDDKDEIEHETSVMPVDMLMKKLKHSEVDLLKFDIEGYEWKLLETLITSTKLPVQLAFELHTKWANHYYVPKAVVEGRGRKAVVELFYRLYGIGYRVVEKAVNRGDRACCEFVLVHVG